MTSFTYWVRFTGELANYRLSLLLWSVMITTHRLHQIFTLLENDDNVKKPYKVITVKMSGDAYDVITDKNTLRVFPKEEIVTEI